MNTEDGHEFKYPPGLPDLTILEPSRVKPLKVRSKCAQNLSELFSEGLARRRDSFSYPDPNHWCGVIVAALREQHFTYEGWGGKKKRSYPDAVIARMFTCPGTPKPADVNKQRPDPVDAGMANQTDQRWTSDYALNSNCRRDSPGDTVFLFEAKAGWNQHGGPELLTFDNHDPKGGLVFLKDGTLKFIRTEEELKQLRWK